MDHKYPIYRAILFTEEPCSFLSLDALVLPVYFQGKEQIPEVKKYCEFCRGGGGVGGEINIK